MRDSVRFALLKWKWRIRRKTIIRCHRKPFVVGGQPLLLEDRIDLVRPWRSSRVLSVPGTNVFYSSLPLFAFSHRLLSYQYCIPVLRTRERAFYRRMLVLGCGGGAVPRWLLEEYPLATVDVVEWHAEMIAICREYFLKRWEGCPRLHYHCTDARDYEAADNSYQFIFCDLFDKIELAPVVTETVFARKLHSLLCDEGILVINCGWHHLAEVRRVYGEYFSNMKKMRRDPNTTQVVVARKG